MHDHEPACRVTGEHDAERGTVTVGIDVTNVGGRAGSEVVQLYVGAPPAADAPPRQLKGFRKVRLHVGERTRVTIELPVADLASFDEARGAWTVHPGATNCSSERPPATSDLGRTSTCRAADPAAGAARRRRTGCPG